jgi:hypothetical protein
MTESAGAAVELAAARRSIGTCHAARAEVDSVEFVDVLDPLDSSTMAPCLLTTETESCVFYRGIQSLSSGYWPR